MASGKVRVLNFITNFNIGGTERQVLNLARGIDPAQFELHFACFSLKGQLLKQFGIDPTGFREHKITSLYNHTALREQLRLAAYVRRNSIHIVHAYGFYANVFAVPAARFAGAPVVIASVRDTGDLLTPMQRRVQKTICRLADCVLANSNAIRRSLVAEGYRESKITVIRNGIIPPEVPPRETGLRQELAIPQHAPIVAVISRLNRLKGIEYFLKAAVRVSALFPETRFLVVGDAIDPAYRHELEGYTARVGLREKIIFLGFRLDVGSILKEVSVAVLPSLSEGLPNSLLESMALGVPVVATNVGGNPEAVEDGVTGRLVPPRDDDAIAQAVCGFLQDPVMAASFGAAGKRRIEDHFSLPRLVQETQRMYTRLLSTTSSPSGGTQEVAHA